MCVDTPLFYGVVAVAFVILAAASVGAYKVFTKKKEPAKTDS